MECQSTVNGVSLTYHQLTFQWHSSDSPVEVECHLSVTRICLFVYLSVYLFVCLFKWHSSDIQVAFSDIRVTFQWHLSGTLLVVLVLSWVTFQWQSSDIQLTVQWQLSGTLLVVLELSWVAVQWQSSDSQVTYQWLSSDSWVALYWIGSTVAVNWRWSGRNLN